MKILFVTIKPEDSNAMIDTLLNERLIAGCNIISNVASKYWWKGKIECEEESILLMETEDDRVDLAMQRINELHSYDVPKIVTIDPKEVNQPYLQWLFEQTRACD
jgi:periplasmic divalent cation tolerance protein